MNPLKSQLKQAGIGGIFGRGIRLYDRDYHIPTKAELDGYVQRAMDRLADRGITPNSYAADGLDCDNFSVIIQAEVMIEWALKHKGKRQFPALSFGRAWQPGHEMNIGITRGGIFVWNYGILTEWDLKKIKEVDIR